MDEHLTDEHLGVYIHIPFCASKCRYCDFYSLANCESLIPRYQQALLGHITEASTAMAPYYVDTVYFGGGTPSYYGARRIAEIFNTLKRSARVLKSAEVTVECNPDSVTRMDMALLRREGVNRISLGVQSTNDDLLKIIGRRHNFAQVKRAVKAIRSAGFENLSLDVIYGLPSQSKADWSETLAQVIALEPEHISCYGLQLEEGTPLYEQYKDSPVLPSQDEQADMYLYAVETLERYGYAQYEISNFARRGYESRHNTKYWALDDYMGFGPGAHSCIRDTRFSFVRDIKRYITGLHSGESILDEYEKLDRLDRAAEYIMLGMRRSRGISKQEYMSVYRSDFTPIEELLREYEHDGWTHYSGDRWSFTSSGFLLSNILIGSLLEAQAEHKLAGNPWVQDITGIDPESIRLPSGGNMH